VPELPEIEVLRRDLEQEVVSKRIKDIEVRPGTNAMKIIPKHGRRKEFQDMLAGAKVEKVERIGKRLLLDLDNAHVLVVDLGESGRLVKTSSSQTIASHTHIVANFTIGGQLRLIDPKLTAEVWVAPDPDPETFRKELRDFHIDPLEDHFTWNSFSAILESKDTGLKDILEDKSFIVGLGHLYSDEILWQAGLRYDRSSKRLSSQDVRRLYRGLMELLQDAVKARGTSWGDDAFVDLLGNPGQFQLELKVWEQEGEACRRCRSTIVREPWDDAFSYLCAQCQS
jgi:formamidopyrimidine-DNA glycosylase